MNLSLEDEVLRTAVDYGGPGGYMLTVVRRGTNDGNMAILFVDHKQVAFRLDCDYTVGNTVQIAEPPKGLDVDVAIDHALECFGTLFVKATGGY